MGEVVVEADYSSEIPLHPSRRHDEEKERGQDDQQVAVSVVDSSPDTISKPSNWHNPQEAWLPITESRNGNIFSVTFHILCSGIGMQALLLPVAFAKLGWVWGIICLSIAFVWQLYTIWILVRLHESVAGIRYSRYLQLAIASFGPKLGKLLAIFPIMYLSGGSCALLIIIGGGAMESFFKIMCDSETTCHAKSLTGTEWFLVFTCIAIVIAQLPNLHSITWTSLIGSITGVGFCTLIWVLSITKGRPSGVSYSPSEPANSDMGKISRILNALGIVALVFRGHNVVLEIQGTLPSSSKHPSHRRMWKGVIVSYTLIAMCQFPLAIAGFWAYGNQIPYNGGLLSTFSKVHGGSTSKFVMGLIYALVIVSCLCTFQIYAMPVFDNLELRYTTKMKRPCPRRVRTALRLFFGGLVFFISVAFPFLGSLAPLVGGITLPLTLAYPCFMWISMKKPRPNGAAWSLNLGLGCFGVAFSVLLAVAAAWTLADKGLHANFFKP